jgi:hypothetical protein
MNCKFTNVLVFAVGAAIGSAVTYMVMKPKYEKLIQEEVDTFKKDFIECMTDMQAASEEESEDEDEERPRQIDWDELEDLDEEEEEDFDPDAEELKEYAEIVKQYSNEEGGAVKVAKNPYVISPFDFGELDGYRQISLCYYADGVLEDEDQEIVTDVDELIGVGSLNTFGEYEDDSVFVRNERLRTDFEILKDYRTYEEATGHSPDQVAE